MQRRKLMRQRQFTVSTIVFCVVLMFALPSVVAGTWDVMPAQRAVPTTAQSLARTQGQATTQKTSVIVVMGPDSEPQSGFDPAYGWGASDHMHEPLIQSTLTVTTDELFIDFDLATDLSVSEDRLIWTVQIRDDVYFSDGNKLTARDVAFTYNTVKAETSVMDFTMLNRAVAIDDVTVQFHMNRPFSIWPYTMAVVGIVPEHAYGPDYGRNPIGSGRYVLKQWDRGQQVILEANPGYYGEAPLIERVTVVFMDEAAAFAAVLAGQVDVAYTAATYSDQRVAGYKLLSFETVDNRGLSLPTTPKNGNVGSDVTGDVAVRRAINLGIDRQRLIDYVLDGYGTPAYSVADKLPWFNEASIVPYDPEQAVALLEAAGWLLGRGGIRERDGVQARLRINYPAGDSVRQALAADVSNQLKTLGFQVTVAGVGWDVAGIRAQTEPMLWGWGAHTPMELYSIHRTDSETGTAGYSGYSNPVVDRYMDAALDSDNVDASYELWKKAQWDGTTGIVDDVPWVWLVNIDHLYWVRENLNIARQKIHPHGHGWTVVNNVDEWNWE